MKSLGVQIQSLSSPMKLQMSMAVAVMLIPALLFFAATSAGTI